MVFLKNNVQNNKKGEENFSKAFGEILSGGDPYVEKILNQLNQPLSQNLNMEKDKNGREVIIPALNGSQTYFFDVDLFNTGNKDVIEFLKNDSEEKKKQKCNHGV